MGSLIFPHELPSYRAGLEFMAVCYLTVSILLTPAEGLSHHMRVLRALGVDITFILTELLEPTD